MVRHFIHKQVEGYFSNRMSTFHHASVLVALGVLLLPIMFAITAFQLGAVLLGYELMAFFAPAWVVFFLAAGVLLSFAGVTLVRGFYEWLSLCLICLASPFRFRSKVTMMLGFTIDFLLSDLFMFAGLGIIGLSYALVAINQRFEQLELLAIAFALLWVGVFFQVAFVSAYANAKEFSKVVQASKHFVLAGPGGGYAWLKK